MSNKNHPIQLLPADLLLLQKHIKLGKNHLKNYLTPNEIDSIFKIADIPEHTEKEIKAAGTEIAGQVALVTNTILTSIVGFFLGFSNLFDVDLTPPILIAISLFSCFVGALIGFQSVKYVKRINNDAVDKWKFINLEIEIVKKISASRKKEIDEKIVELGTLLNHLQIRENPEELKNPHTDLQKCCLKWLLSVNNTSEECKLIDEKIKFNKQYDVDVDTFKTIAKKLNKAKRSPVNLKSWIQSNLRRLVIELVPTLLGGASSIFVYIGGVQTLSEGAESSYWVSFLERPEIRITQLIILVLITCYLGFSYFFINKKAFKRDKELANIESNLIDQEKEMDLVNDQLLKIKEGLKIFESVYRKNKE